MIQAYVDDSGGKGQDIFVFSALVGTAERWTQIAERWGGVLKESPSIRYFKMSEATSLGGEFHGFSKEERDEKFTKLCAIINTEELTEVSRIADLDAFEKIWAPRVGRPACEPYFFPFHMLNMSVGYEVLSRGEKERFEIFFDENVIFGPRAKAWYPVVCATLEPDLRAIMPIEPLFRSDRDILPLQAADIFAWMNWSNNRNGLGKFSWLMTALEAVKLSRYTGPLDAPLLKSIIEHSYSPEEMARHKDILQAYQETFGHEWPPKTKAAKKKARRAKG